MSTSTGVAGALVMTSTARPAGLALRSAAGLVLPGSGLGVRAGVISGKSPAAFPAATTMALTFGSGIGPGPMSELVAPFRFGRGPRGGAPADGLGDAERVVLALAGAEPESVELAAGVGLEDAEGVGLAVGVGDVEGAELALGVGAGDVERVGLGVDVGGGEVEGAGLALVVGAGVDGDGLGVPEAPELVLADAGEAEGEEATALANADSCVPSDSADRRRPPVTKPDTTFRQCVTGT
jgi:hypothetical protein